MKFAIHGKNVKVTPAIKAYIEEKIGRLDKFLTDAESITAKVVVRVHNNQQIVEITIPIKGIILRAEERNENLYAAIDLVSEKLERQVKKNKTKLKDKIDYEMLQSFKQTTVDEEEPEKAQIVRRKKLEMKPMDEEEAILQMDLLGHDFFVYHDYKIDAICVLYRRKDGKYGLIVTE